MRRPLVGLVSLWKSPWTALWTALLFAVPASAWSAGERGLPPVRVFTPDEHGAGIQSFALGQGPDGILWVGNLHGVLSWDGAWWRLHPFPTAVYGLAVDHRGTVAVGGIDELGLVAVDDSGSYSYRSLTSLLPSTVTSPGDVRAVHATPRGFVFATDRHLLRWHEGAFELALEVDAETGEWSTFGVGDEVWVWTRGGGLGRLVGDRLEPLPGGEALRDREIGAIVVAEQSTEIAAPRVLLAVSGEGLHRWRPGGAPESLAAEASAWAARHRVVAATRLPDGRVALASRSGGVLLLGPDGKIDQILGTAAGLPTQHVRALYCDREGHLWLALDNSLAMVDVSSALTVVDARMGLEGNVYGIVRHRGVLWVSTASDTYALERGVDGSTRARPLGDVRAAAAELQSVGDDLLIGGSDGILIHRGEGRRVPVQETEGLVVYSLLPSRVDERRVWVGHRRGIGSILREADGWRWEGILVEAPGYIGSLVERPGQVLWAGSVFDGVQRLEWEAGEGPPRLRRIDRLGSGEMSVTVVGGKLLVVQPDEPLRWIDETRRRLVSAGALARLEPTHQAFAAREDSRGNLWLNTVPPRVITSGPRGDLQPLEILTGGAADIQELYAERDGVVWLGTDRGLLRHDGLPRRRDDTLVATLLPAPLLRRATVDEHEVLIAAGGSSPLAATLRHGAGRLRIEAAPASFRRGVELQFRLDPLDASWGRWSTDPAVEYTNLPPGEHLLRVRSRYGSDAISEEARWVLNVTAPWYLSLWARFSALVGLVLLVGSVSRLRSRSLRLQAEHLRTVVDRRTSDLAHTIDQLRSAQAEVLRQNALLATANTELEELSLHDDLTGLANRRAFERALTEDWRRAQRYRQRLAVVMMDLDHFKSINDRSGHARGDEWLQRVGRLIAAELRRAGDLAARYGGEEFAILLPSCDAQGAARVAEKLRRGIERLSLGEERRLPAEVTGSFGVASWSPDVAGQPGAIDRPEALVAAADAALYRAKREGRNRVVIHCEQAQLQRSVS